MKFTTEATENAEGITFCRAPASTGARGGRTTRVGGGLVSSLSCMEAAPPIRPPPHPPAWGSTQSGGGVGGPGGVLVGRSTLVRVESYSLNPQKKRKRLEMDKR